ncbi:ABC transporter permease [Amphibacillus cookii]|uniref:ABC transporter permease n=1 Tax=Amphibacillus cookii TaxID=767787 RepID=UPI00195A89E4|nr:ABC transporter permease [Amphibacillus cookii]MBM7542606.1 ABC-2 type transport system permease protein [Amphibacillus cookii]
MFNLIRNEWEKILKKKSTFVMIGLLILAIIALSGILKYVDNNDEGAGDDWQVDLQQQIEADREGLEEYGDRQVGTYYQRNLAINEYRLEHEISPSVESNVWTLVDEAKMLTSFIGLFTIVVAAGIVAGEFSTGTIKLLLIRPMSRTKILLSKYLTVILFSLLLLAIVYGLSSIIGVILYGFPPDDAVHLAYQNGEVVERSQGLQLIVTYLLYSIDILMLTTMAFMISAVFRNSSLAIGLSMFLLFVGNTVANILAMQFDWAKYLLFLNTDLTVYFDGIPTIEGMTLTFSIIMLALYFLIFHALAFFFFKRRDVAA